MFNSRKYIARHYLFDQINCRLQVHSKINERPGDALAFVLLLLQHKHVMVEVLLQAFVRKIYAKLIETIELDVDSLRK